MNEQLSLFDVEIATSLKHDEVGSYKKTPGAVIPHIMRHAYIGKKVLIDKSTHSMQWYRVGILEDYIWNPGAKAMRCIVFTGERQRHLIDMVPGVEIYETEPLDRVALARQNLMRELWG